MSTGVLSPIIPKQTNQQLSGCVANNSAVGQPTFKMDGEGDFQAPPLLRWYGQLIATGRRRTIT